MNTGEGKKAVGGWLVLWSLILVSLLAAVVAGGSAAFFAAPAATFTVNSTVDAVDANPGDGVCATAAGECTLRAAVQETNALPGGDTVIVPSGTYTLTIAGRNEDTAAKGDLDLTDDVIIMGAGSTVTAVDAANLDRVVETYNDIQVTLSGLTLRGGELNDLDGAGIHHTEGILKLVDSVITDNLTRNRGAGIRNEARLEIENSTISNNTADPFEPRGGGIDISDSGVLTLTNSTVSGNMIYNQSDNAYGGGIFNAGVARIINSAIISNTASARIIDVGSAFARGGGIHNDFGATLTVINSTLSGNSAAGDSGGFGGGIWTNNGAVIVSSTIVSNNASSEGGGLAAQGSRVRMQSSILAGNTGPTALNCAGRGVASGGYNVVGTVEGCDFRAKSTDQLDVNPLLRPLQDNGGPTQTHALRPISPAIDAGRSAGCTDENGALLLSDQRGYVRAVDGDDNGSRVCDAGAFEYASYVKPDFTLSIEPTTVEVCAPDDAVFTTTIDALGSFGQLVALSASGQPIGTTTEFDPNPVTPPATSSLTIGNTGAAAAGVYPLDIVGVATTITHQIESELIVSTAVPTPPVLLTPPDGATNQPTRPLLSWTAASQSQFYTVEIAEDPAFSQVVESVTQYRLTAYTPRTDLALGTHFYWRVRAENGCGPGPSSAVFSFSTLGSSFAVNSPADASDANPGDTVCAASDGSCTLRAAIEERNALATGRTVTITLPAGTYTLTLSADLTPTANTAVIKDPAALEAPVIDANGTVRGSRAFYVPPDTTVELIGVVIRGGLAEKGGAIYNDGRLSVVDTTLTGNVAEEGGAIFSTETLLVGGSTLAQNVATERSGGAIEIWDSGLHGYEALIEDSLITGNSAGYNGGGVHIEGQFGSVTIRNSTISANYSVQDGGGIANGSLEFVIEGSTVISNTAAASAPIGISHGGGGLYNSLNGNFTITGSTFSGNQALAGAGGGLYLDNGDIISNTVIANNTAPAGGGVYFDSGWVTVYGSTIAGNVALAGDGGGIRNGGYTLDLANSTISGNTASGFGGGLYSGFASTNNVTIVENVAGVGGGWYYVGTTEPVIKNSLVANNTAPTGPDCSGFVMTSAGYNLLGNNNGCSFTPTVGDQVGTPADPIDPLLGPLQDNGGPTWTHALLQNSPAVDAGNSQGCTDEESQLLPTDQRGYPRPVDGDGDGQVVCDVGAYEFSDPGFVLSVSPTVQGICLPGGADYQVAVLPLVGYNSPITMTLGQTPAGVTGTFEPNPVLPGSSSVLAVTATTLAQAGSYQLEITGTGPEQLQDTTTAGLDLYSTVPGRPGLLSPADGATDVPPRPTFVWDAAVQGGTYALEVATDSSFLNIVASAAGMTEFVYRLDTPLNFSTTYYWRVWADNTCGQGDYSSVFSFTTTAGWSTTFTINSPTDSVDTLPGDNVCADSNGFCTLRAAIQEANAWAGPLPVLISLPAGTYNLTIAGAWEDTAATGDLDITAKLTLIGDGADVTTIYGNGFITADRVFHVLPGTAATISGLTIRDGRAADEGGGIFNSGILTVTASSLTANDAAGYPFAGGGGIYNSGMLLVESSVLVANTANDRGAGLYNEGATAIATVRHSTISGNIGDYGGGLFNDDGELTVENSTITNNQGLISTGGLYNEFGTVKTNSSIWAGNTGVYSNPNCYGSVTSIGYNLLGNNSGCSFTTTTGDQVGTSSDPIDPLLGALQDNGGPTLTHALLPGSPAVDAGDPLNCPAIDQRGYPRPADGDGDGEAVCDIGAYERQTTSLLACSAPGLPIPDRDPTGVTDDLVLTEPGNLVDLNVQLVVTHPYVGDLIFALTHLDSGTAVTLMDRPGFPPLPACNGDNIDATLDDEGSGPVEDACSPTPPAIAGPLIPNELLSAFDGEAAAGTWRLTAIDNGLGSLGTLDSWCVEAATDESG
ncbi:MAG: choice-of-anchor Q domain-containing protein [Chloroflexota bacterium]